MSTKIVALPMVEAAGRIFNNRVRRPLAIWWARKKAYNELMALDDHMLADIGITRCDIPGIVWGQIKPRRAANENQPNIAA